MYALVFWLLLAGGVTSPAKMPDLSGVIGIHISIEWDCGWSSWKRSHLITLRDSVSVCATTIRVSEIPNVETRTDTIQTSTISSFLKLIGTVETKSKPYDPVFNHTDDYPYKRISLILPSDSIVIESWSQSRNGKPWQVILGTDTLVSKSSAIHESLKLLGPYFHEELLDSLVKTAQSQN